MEVFVPLVVGMFSFMAGVWVGDMIIRRSVTKRVQVLLDKTEGLVAACQDYFEGGPMPENIANAFVDLGLDRKGNDPRTGRIPGVADG